MTIILPALHEQNWNIKAEAALLNLDGRIPAPGTVPLLLMPQGYGGVGDTRNITDGVTTASSTTFTSAATTFVPGDVGKAIMIAATGVAGVQLTTAIATYVDAHTITLAAPAPTTIASGALAKYGTDDTTAIDLMFAAGIANDAPVVFPGGKTYFYNGAGFGATKPRVYTEAGADAATIVLGTGKSLIVSPGGGTPAAVSTLHVQNIRTFGGFGLIRLTYTGPQSGESQFIVKGFHLGRFTGTGISSLSSDTPFWKIQGIMLGAAGSPTTMGVAIQGLTDQADIDVDFLGLRVDVKLDRGGCNARVRGCHVGFSAYTSFPRIGVWVVPSATVSNSGQGLVINQFKFGSENWSPNDYNVVYADSDPGTGADFATQFPLWTASTGYITGHQMDHVNVSRAGAGGSVVWSTTPNVGGCRYAGVLSGSLPDYILGFLNPPAANRETADNVVGPWTGLDIATEGSMPPKACNAPGMVRVIDPTGLFDAHPTHRASVAVGDPIDYVNLLPTVIRSFTLSGGTSRTNVADGFGGIDAAELTFAAGGNNAQTALTLGSITVGTPVWIEFDAKMGAASPLAYARAYAQYTGSGAIHFRRVFAPPATGWARFRFTWTPREASASILLGIDANSLVGAIQIGRIRAYHARESINTDGRMLALGVAGTASVAGATSLAALTATGTVALQGANTLGANGASANFTRTDGGDPTITLDKSGTLVGQVGGITGGGVRVTNGAATVVYEIWKAPLAKVANYTILTSDGQILASGAANTQTLPSATSAGAGCRKSIRNIDASNSITVAATAGNVDGAATATLAPTVAKTFISDGSNWWSV